MAVIYECDGCNKQSSDSRIIKTVGIAINSQRGQGEHAYHLCEGCEVEVRRRADPRTWLRALKEPS